MEADCPKFQHNWKEHITKTELGFIQIITDQLKVTDHLKDKIQLAKHQLREDAKTSFISIRSANISRAKADTALNGIIDEAHKERKE